MSNEIPWEEKINTFQINPHGASVDDISKMATELAEKKFATKQVIEEFDEKFVGAFNKFYGHVTLESIKDWLATKLGGQNEPQVKIENGGQRIIDVYEKIPQEVWIKLEKLVPELILVIEKVKADEK